MNLRGRNKVSTEFSMSSMTDIVFLLLIFFMLTSPVVTPEALDLLLPQSKGKTTSQQNIAVSIDKDLKIYINSEQIPAGQVETRLQSELGDAEDPTIILRAQKTVPIQDAVDIMGIAKRNNYKIVLAVKPR